MCYNIYIINREEVYFMTKYNYIKWFNEIDKNDIPVVGGKGANLGEIDRKSVV